MRLRLASFYRGLAALARAGVVTSEAVAQLRRDGTLPEPMGHAVVGGVADGRPLAAVLAEWPNAVPAEDVALLEAGEATGRMEESLDRLAELHEQRRRAWRKFWSEAWYPLMIAHFAVLVMPIGLLGVRGKLSISGWFGWVLTILIPIYLLVFLFVLLGRQQAWRDRYRRWIDALPGFGAAARHRRRARFCRVLEAAYEAGVKLDRGLALAARAAGLRGGEAAAAAVAQGQALQAGLAPAGIFKAPELARLATAEHAGEIASALRAIGQDEEEQADAILHRAMVTVGKGVYILVALAVVWYALTIVGTMPRF